VPRDLLPVILNCDIERGLTLFVSCADIGAALKLELDARRRCKLKRRMTPLVSGLDSGSFFDEQSADGRDFAVCRLLSVLANNHRLRLGDAEKRLIEDSLVNLIRKNRLYLLRPDPGHRIEEVERRVRSYRAGACRDLRARRRLRRPPFDGGCHEPLVASRGSGARTDQQQDTGRQPSSWAPHGSIVRLWTETQPILHPG